LDLRFAQRFESHPISHVPCFSQFRNLHSHQWAVYLSYTFK